MDDTKAGLLARLQVEVNSTRERAENVRIIAEQTLSHRDRLLAHAAIIDRSADSLEEIMRTIRKAWQNDGPTAENPKSQHRD